MGSHPTRPKEGTLSYEARDIQPWTLVEVALIGITLELRCGKSTSFQMVVIVC